jgi:hypothetical protein
MLVLFRLRSPSGSVFCRTRQIACRRVEGRNSPVPSTCRESDHDPRIKTRHSHCPTHDC